MKELCLKAREILIEEGNVQYVDAPVTVSFELSLPLSLGLRLRCDCIFGGLRGGLTDPSTFPFFLANIPSHFLVYRPFMRTRVAEQSHFTRSAEIYMGNSSTSWSCSRSGDGVRRRRTYSWVSSVSLKRAQVAHF